MRRTKEEAEVTREKLLDVALPIFSKKGYAKTTLSDIAKEAGLTRGAIYWHFGGKSELYNALVEERFSNANKLILDIFTDNRSPLEKIHNLLITSMEYVEKDKEYRAIMELTLLKTEVIGEVEDMMKIKEEGTKAMIGEVEKIIEKGKSLGQFRDDLNSKSVAISIISLINGIVSLWLMNSDSFRISEHSEAITRNFLMGITK